MTEPVAIITGAARGIGAATARRLAADGWKLVLVDRCSDDAALDYPLATAADLHEVVASCGGTASATAVIADVRDQGSLDAAVGVALEQFGGLDAALAIAGAISGGGQTWSIDDLEWSTMLGVNLEGVWRLAKAAVPALLLRPPPRRGRFVAVASTAGMRGFPRLAAYAAAKHGVIGLVRSMAAELGPEGITVNALAPGSTTTAMLDASAALYQLDDVEEFASHHLLERLIDPEEVSSLLHWLCSDESAAMTGAVLPIDAGMTAY